MKKFLVYLLVIVMTVSLGFAIFYLVRDNEVISISSASIYKDVGQKFTIDIDHRNPKKSTTIDITTSDAAIVSYNDSNNEFKAESGGVARINFRTSNTKFRNIWCDVIVGDGTVESPFYISTAEQLAAIGMGVQLEDGTFAGAEGYEQYVSNACYKLVSDVDVSTVNGGYWVPLRKFSGRFDGNGFTILNVNIDRAAYIAAFENTENYDPNIFTMENVGFFQEITSEAVVYNVKFDNLGATGSYVTFGTVAALNYGTIERVEIKNAEFMLQTNTFGGIVGKNITTEAAASAEKYERYIARVDRCSIAMVMGEREIVVSGQASKENVYNYNVIGGLVGENDGGVVIYSYANGNIHFDVKSTEIDTATITYGGIVGKNTYKKLNTIGGDYISYYQGGNIKDCYSNIRTNTSAYLNKNITDKIIIAGAIGVNIDYTVGNYDNTSIPVVQNYLLGIYYNKDNLNYIPADAETNTQKTFKGVGLFTFNGTVVFEEKKTIVYGLTTDEMRISTNFVSHTTKEIEFTEDGTSKGIVTKEILWLFDTVWAIDSAVNDGMPYLNYQLVYIPDDFGSAGVPVINGDKEYSFEVEIDYAIDILSAANGRLTLYVNQEYNLVVSPKGAEVTWESGDDTIVSVDENGKVKGLKVGVTTVSATTAGGSSDTITVIVEDIVYTIFNYPESLTLKTNDTYQFKDVSVYPANTTLVYSVQDTLFADITADGLLTTKGEETTSGFPTYVFIQAGNTKVAIPLTIKADVPAPTTQNVTLKVNKDYISGEYGQVPDGKITVTSVDGDTSSATINSYSYTFTSNATSVVAVDSSGNYTIKSYGWARVTVTATKVVGSTTYTGTLLVYFEITEPSGGGGTTPPVVTPTFSLNKSSVNIYVGDSYQLTGKSNVQGTVTWSTSNSSVATVSNGLVTAKGTTNGSSCTITAKFVSNSGTTLYAYCTVNVLTVKQATLSVSPQTSSLEAGKSLNVTLTGNMKGNFAYQIVWNGTSTKPTCAWNGSASSVTTTKITVSSTTAVSGTLNLNLRFTGENGTTASATAKITISPSNAYSKYIYNAQQMNAVRYHLGKDFIIAANIDLSGYSNWEPIGTKSAPFTGTITAQKASSGAYYKVSNIKTKDTTYAGLFGYAKNANLSNIIVETVTSTGDYAGGVLGCAVGTKLSNCQAYGTTVTARVNAGGVVGRMETSSSASSCKLSGSKTVQVTYVSGKSGTKAVGGICGYATSSSISSARVDITGNICLQANNSLAGYAGGVVGYTNSSVSSSLVLAKVSANKNSSSNSAGGIVGYTNSSVTGCTVRSTTINGYYAGGIGGTLSNGQTVKLTFSNYKNGYRKSDLSSSSYYTNVSTTAVRESVKVVGVRVGGLFGVISGGVVKNCYTRAELNGSSGSSVKGGFASYINSNNFKNTGGSGTCGIVENCYSASKFTGSGSNYSVTASLIHNYATFGDGSDRTAGYIFNYVFDNDVDGSAKYYHGSNLFAGDKVEAKKSTSQMKSSSTYTAKGFSTSTWNLSGYPTLKAEK